MAPLKSLTIRFVPARVSCNLFSNKAITRHQNYSIYCYHHLFEETSQREISSVNSILTSYIRDGDATATWDFFFGVHQTRVDLDSYTFTPVLRACSAFQNSIQGRQVHALMVKTGSDTEAITKTALMDMYSKSGLLDDSVGVFDEMGFRDVVAWNVMASCYLRHDMPVKAIGVFKEMRKEMVEFSEFTLCSVLKACTCLKAYRQGKQIHSLVVVIGRDLVVLSTALIDFYCSLGYIDEAMKIYNTLSWRNDDITCNSLISGCVLNKKYDMAMSIMGKIRPNVIALTSYLDGCSENSDMWIGKQIHGVAVRRGFMYDTQFCNALLDMYAKCGKILWAGVVFEAIHKKDVVSWTSMIDAYGSHGYGAEAVELFKQIGGEGIDVLPNCVTFLAVLSACGHSGLVEEGRECFILALEKYGLEPGPEHYASLIDILGRAGRIEEVWSLFHDLVNKGSKSTAVVWSALLNACKLNQDVERGEFAAKRLLELEPDNPGNYVAVSNFYAATGRWDSVDELRSSMKNRGLAKEEGSSWIDFSPNEDISGKLGTS